MNNDWSKKTSEQIERARSIYRRADEEERALSSSEEAEVENALSTFEREKAEKQFREKIDPGGPGVTYADPNATAGGGWDAVATAIATKKESHVEIPTESLLGAKAGPVRKKDLTAIDLIDGSRAELPMLSVLGADSRFLHPHLPRKTVSNELSIGDYRQTGSRTINGDVLRELTATTAKATLDLELSYVSQDLKQVAVVVENVPNALLNSTSALLSFLTQEAGYQLARAVDDHVLDVVLGTPHEYNAEGSTLFERIRNAIGEHRENGYAPTLLAVSRQDAAELDLLLTGGGYVFGVQALGGSSPVFGQTVTEVSGVIDPLLIDPLALGILVLGNTKVDVDTSAGFTTNTSTVRCEASVLMVVRNGAACFELAMAS